MRWMKLEPSIQSGVSQKKNTNTVKVKSLRFVQLFVTPWIVAYQFSPPKGFSRQEYWSGVPLPSLMTILDSNIKKQRHYFANKGLCSEGYGFSSSHVWMWELDYKESWTPKSWCFWTVVLEKTLEIPLDYKEIILKETIPGCSLEGLMLKLKLQYFGHLMRRADSFEKKTGCWERLRAGGEWDSREICHRVVWHHQLNWHEFR